MADRIWMLMALVSLASIITAAENVNYTFGQTMVRFLGKSPNFQIYPNTSLSSYLQLRFSKFEERDSSDKKVQGHSVESLASADPTWTAGNTTTSDGTNLTYVRMTLKPADSQGFSADCPTNSGRRMLAAPSSTTTNATVTVTLYFGLDQNTSFPFGQNKTVNVSKGGLKFNVEYSDWPFCNANNILSMEIDLLIKGDAAAQPAVSTASDGTQVLSVPIGDNMTSNIYFANYAYEAQNGTHNMTVGVNATTSGTTSTVTLRLPNPTPNTTVYYDPTVTSTESGQGGSAAGLRRTYLSALLTALLSAVYLLA
ncbi:hypothetical protein VOLCADRAFT_90488 [Volvox carteri f. nagariensis]|uniref:Pherophorin domain-containing protein n=1 Tax=Volvox carteri f. nagariensis TaxID=3068 RepID=D8TUI5_VOLCA|nr:uncharacterized protein VOLCADRAFT_90488 [Volvox carteri f. nagariensis]EFJ48714.1 hypothetical protein VOLCADRAFT_90488 [Volvox carteri f. nagariensis]|eukprot:XP_002950046.1 hypothetical protein VOLCADRAFT_90488 [Volvox carteri f. nagariensis]